jgi:uncharacterized delta-60 repeat protein
MKKFYFLFFITLSFSLFSQNETEVAHNYGLKPKINNPVNVVTVQQDGKTIIGGVFTQFDNSSNKFIVRLNIDGSKDNTFNVGTGFDNYVNLIVQQTDGKIIVGGDFTTYNNVPAKRIIRLNSDGSIDTTFNTGLGFNDNVKTIAIQNDRKILVGGSFEYYNNIYQEYIVRLNVDGTIDNSFNTGNGFGSQVNTISLQTDGKIVVGGYFSTYDNLPANGIVRLNTDGTKDNTFEINTVGSENVITDIVLQSDGKVIVSGDFRTVFGSVSNYKIIRLDSNGMIDPLFSTQAIFNYPVQSIVLQNDGKLVVGGTFTLYNGLSSNKIIRLNTNGLKDVSFNEGIGFDANVNSISFQTDGKLVVGGDFNNYNGNAANFLTRLNNGIIETNYIENTGFNSHVLSIVEQTDGKIIVGGVFNNYNGLTEKNIIRLNEDDTKDTTFNSGTGFNGPVRSIALQADGKILVGGSFTSYNGLIEKYIIRLNSDGTKDTTFNTGLGFNFSVNTIVLQPDGKILVGGSFTTYNGSFNRSLIRLNSNGSKDTSFNTILNTDGGYISSIALQMDGKINIAGEFELYYNAPIRSFARLNSNGLFDTGLFFNNGGVKTILMQPDQKIVLGGYFYEGSGGGVTHRNKITRLNTSANFDSSFSTGTTGLNFDVKTIALQPDGKLILGGGFTTYQSILAQRIIRLNPNGEYDNTFNTEDGFNENVNVVLIKSDGSILVGGEFTTYKNNNSSAYLIKLNGNSTLSSPSYVKNNSVSLWPNPTQNNLNINTSNNSITAISIYNFEGKLIYENTNSNTTIDVSNFASGLYLAKITTEKGTITKKFIKE